MKKIIKFVLIFCLIFKIFPVQALEKCYLKGTEEIDHSYSGKKKIIIYCKYECLESNILKMKKKEEGKECEEVTNNLIDDEE